LRFEVKGPSDLKRGEKRGAKPHPILLRRRRFFGHDEKDKGLTAFFGKSVVNTSGEVQKRGKGKVLT